METGGGSEYTQEERGSVTENTVDGLEFVGWTGEVAEEAYEVTAVVRNSGVQSTSLLDYSYSLALYDESGSGIENRGTSVVRMGGDLASGETGELTVSATGVSEPDAVASYELSLTCGMLADSVYCE